MARMFDTDNASTSADAAGNGVFAHAHRLFATASRLSPLRPLSA
jgi:hypothetical protein